ncbi:sugar transferase [Phycicoccus sonneratiae]|uniref:Sugar transferase n=1 Tax=Phycicoccus sonneratiae TaxID=2807628 RepID=A0ABS2CQC2_9MICO|nr:sugar transferase [Phycicoccus sonneraticus]MBM6402087.1 sugar transferase [Phycicoccus sonneraticus]
MSIAQGTGARPWVTPRGAAHIDLASYGHAPVKSGLSTWEKAHRRSVIAVDAMAAVFGALVGLAGRDALFGDRLGLWGSTDTVRLTLLVAAFAWIGLLARNGAYASRFVGAGSEEYRAVTRSAVGLVAAVGFASFALQLEFSRGVLLLSVPAMTLTTLLGRYAVRRRLARQRLAGRHLRPTLVVGDARAALDVAHRIEDDPATTGMQVAAICVSDLHDPVLATDNGTDFPVLGTEAATLDVVDRLGVAAVAVASSPTISGHALRRLGWALEQRDVDLLVAPGVVEVAGPRLTMRRAAGLPMLHVERPVQSGWRYATKLLADRVLGATALLLLSPVLLTVALLVRRDSPGPAFFRQDRVGEGGHVFSMYKFRTMVVDAEARLAALAEQSEGNDVLFKMRRDPRITRIGEVLRRFSLDELPQLVNVVRGEMSLVGPRPPLAAEVDRYESDAVRRLRVRPGMTGLWQVSGRSDLSWMDSVRLDLWYVDNWSLALDGQILLRTVQAVVRGRGAY